VSATALYYVHSLNCVRDLGAIFYYCFNKLLLTQGFGVLLMEEAETIAKDEHGSVKIAVISGKPNPI
jgi:hypothetical protein